MFQDGSRPLKHYIECELYVVLVPFVPISLMILPDNLFVLGIVQAL